MLSRVIVAPVFAALAVLATAVSDSKSHPTIVSAAPASLGSSESCAREAMGSSISAISAAMSIAVNLFTLLVICSSMNFNLSHRERFSVHIDTMLSYHISKHYSIVSQKNFEVFKFGKKG